MEFLKYLLLPSGFTMLLLMLGLIARFVKRTQRFSWHLLAAGAVLTLLLSSGKTATFLMSPLEYEWPAVHDAREHPGARHIVVLTGYAADEPHLPLSDRLNISSAFRVLQALELWQERQDLDIIVSGSQPTARIMAEVLVAAGIPANKVRIEGESQSTADSAELLVPFVNDDEFLLVTSGGHMRRSVAAMHRFGLKPIPAPTDHKVPPNVGRAEFRPRPSSLEVSDLAIHEYLGVLWYRLRDRA